MTLSARRSAIEVPSYSVSGDLLPYLDCGLRYRYQHRGSLPPSRPVQFWAGQFVHGVLEEALRYWQATGRDLPWPPSTMEQLVNLVIRRLAGRGLSFRGFRMLGFAIERAIAAVETWGPDLFPIIDDAEIRLRAVRSMPAGTTSVRGDMYEVQGVADVVASSDPLRLLRLLSFTGALLADRGPVDIVIDYKGMRRPRLSDPIWRRQEWQIQTYAWLRAQDPSAAEVRCGLLLYLNELVPGTEEMDALREEVAKGQPDTDIETRASDLAVLEHWPDIKKAWDRQLREWENQVREWYMEGRENGRFFPRLPTPTPWLSPAYRRMRSVRLVPVDGLGIDASLSKFDDIVGHIEGCVAKEVGGERLTHVWPTEPSKALCMRCDFRSHCPAPRNPYRRAPRAP